MFKSCNTTWLTIFEPVTYSIMEKVICLFGMKVDAYAYWRALIKDSESNTGIKFSDIRRCFSITFFSHLIL